MNLGMQLRTYQQQRLTCEQKQVLKYLLQLKLQHDGPEFPEATRGLEGMLIADKMLKEKDARGILIGGCARAIWNQRRTPKELSVHKDVDVAVLDDSFSLEKSFAGGIDWWLPKKEVIEVKSYGGYAIGEQQWWENGNQAVLYCGFSYNKDNTLAPGLYLPSPEWVMLYEEAVRTALVDQSISQDIDEEVLEKFRKHLSKGIHQRLPAFVAQQFSGQILAEKYSKEKYNESRPISLREMERETIFAIQGIQ